MTRLVDWEARLFEVIEHHSAIPLDWGMSDCLVMAADAVEAQTGVDPMVDFRGRYSSEIGAKRVLAKESPDGIAGVVSDRFQPVDVAHAQRGDIGLVEYDGADCCVIVLGVDAVGKSKTGRLILPTKFLKQAFKVR